MKKVKFKSNGSFFKDGVYDIEEKNAIMLESKGYGSIEKDKEVKTVKAKK